MATQNKRPSVKGKKKIGSADLNQNKPNEKKPSFFSKRVPLLRPEEETLDLTADEQSINPGSNSDVATDSATSTTPTEPSSGLESAVVSDAPVESVEPLAADALSADFDLGEKTSRPSVGKKRRQTAAQGKEAAARFASLTNKWGKKGMACIAAVVAVVLVAGALFVWNTYFRYDDAQDVKGEWLVSGGTVVVAIDAQNIRMPGNVSYAYELDDQKKKITFSFSELSGGGEYDFSHGRNVLTVSEGNDGSAGVTTFLKISDNVKAKPRVISEKEARKYMNELAPQSLLTASGMAETDNAADEASEESGQANAKKKSSAKKES